MCSRLAKNVNGYEAKQCSEPLFNDWQYGSQRNI